jgi:hypothetical protein
MKSPARKMQKTESNDALGSQMSAGAMDKVQLPHLFKLDC